MVEFTKPEPWLLIRDDVLEYLQIRDATLSRWVKLGLVPGPIEGTNRYDKRAIDAYLDRASGLEGNGTFDVEAEVLRRINEEP